MMIVPSQNKISKNLFFTLKKFFPYLQVDLFLLIIFISQPHGQDWWIFWNTSEQMHQNELEYTVLQYVDHGEVWG